MFGWHFVWRLGELDLIPDGGGKVFTYWKEDIKPRDIANLVMEAYESGYDRGKKEAVIEGDNKGILIDSLCEEFGITEGKMRRAIDSAIKKMEKENRI